MSTEHKPTNGSSTHDARKSGHYTDGDGYLRDKQGCLVKTGSGAPLRDDYGTLRASK